MDRLQKSAIIISLLEALQQNGSWCGETHIQKAMYCLQEIRDVPTGFEFILYKHGPFSFDLQDELTAMSADGLMDVRANSYPYGPSLFATSMGKAIRAHFPITLKRYGEAIEYIAKAFGSRGVAELERLATALYVTHEMDVSSGNIEEMALRIHELKPHIPLARAKDAAREIDDLLANAG
jgi:uncharacterized protein YwgA